MRQKEVNSQNNYRYCLVPGLLLTIVLFIVSCSVTQSDEPGNEGTRADTSLTPVATITPVPLSVIPEPSSIVTDTVVPLPSVLPSPTATSTLSVMPTSSPTPTPTLTPLPTIEPQQRGQVYNDLISSNGGCELPCWWGFELGRTSLNEVRQFYAAFDTYITEQSGRNGISILEVLFVDPQIENGEQVVHSFVAQDGVLIEAEIELDHPDYQIKPILQRLGQPLEAWMWTIPEPYLGKLPTRYRLYFPEQGALVSYATGGIKVDNAVNVCFDKHGGTTIHLWNPNIWDPDGDKGIVERISQSGSAFTLDGYHPIEEASNWDAEQFYTVLTDPNHSECLETPSNLWPSPY